MGGIFYNVWLRDLLHHTLYDIPLIRFVFQVGHFYILRLIMHGTDITSILTTTFNQDFNNRRKHQVSPTRQCSFERLGKA
jgi:hypothetical protein